MLSYQTGDFQPQEAPFISQSPPPKWTKRLNGAAGGTQGWSLGQAWPSPVVQWPFLRPLTESEGPPVPCGGEPTFHRMFLCQTGLGVTISVDLRQPPPNLQIPIPDAQTTQEPNSPRPSPSRSLPQGTHPSDPSLPRCLCSDSSLCSPPLFPPGKFSLNLQGPATRWGCLQRPSVLSH